MIQQINGLKNKLDNLIVDMSNNLKDFVKNPDKDFTRKRKLPFVDVAKLLLSIGGNTIYSELLTTKGYDADTPTSSAFVQQRDKIKPSAFEHIFKSFTKNLTNPKTYKRYRLYAVDGSDLHISTNPKDELTHSNNNSKGSGHNLLHLNAMFDLENKIYVDALLQPNKRKNEHSALIDMMKRTDLDEKSIVICDRLFESYNAIAHFSRKCKFLIRAKDVDSIGILSKTKLPETDEFDVDISFVLTKSSTKQIRNNPDIYRRTPSSTHVEFLDENNKFLDMSFRAVRLKLYDDSYVAMITNLPRDEFSPQELKELYNKRWGIETSFRELKYALGLLNFHSKKRRHIEQEIFAKLTAYNFAQMVTMCVVTQKADSDNGSIVSGSSEKQRKYDYQVNFTVAIKVCMEFLRGLHKITAETLIALISKNVLPIRLGRRAKRTIRYKRSVSFIYRVA